MLLYADEDFALPVVDRLRRRREAIWRKTDDYDGQLGVQEA